jgi:hypothetical protein
MGAARSLKAVLFVLGTLATARAIEPSRVLVQVECDGAPATDELIELLSAELSPTRVEARDAAAPIVLGDLLVVLHHCDEDLGRIRATLWANGKSTTETLTLSDVAPPSRSRTLAIALADAIRPPRAPEPPPTDAPSSANAIAPASAPPANAEPPSARPIGDVGPPYPDRVRGFATGAFRLAIDTTTPLVGLSGGVRWRRLSGGLLLLASERQTSLGTLRILAATTTAAFDLVPFGASAVFTRGELGMAIVDGTTNGSAVASTDSTFHGAFAVGVRTELDVRLFSLDMGVDGGVASSAIAQAAHHDEASLGAWFVTATLGAALPRRR